MQYAGEQDLTYIMGLVDNELSEPYSIFTYRRGWQLCWQCSGLRHRQRSAFYELCCLCSKQEHLPVEKLGLPQLNRWLYSVRYFLHTWPALCFLAFHEQHCFGVVVCKMEPHGDLLRGYIAMLVVEHAYRGLGVGMAPPALSHRQTMLQQCLSATHVAADLVCASKADLLADTHLLWLGTQLVRRAIETMMASDDLDEVVLEAEVTNQGALSLYTNLGFIRDKRLARCACPWRCIRPYN